MTDWGSVPDWIAAVSTTLALAGAAIAARSALDTVKQQNQQLEILKDEAQNRETMRSRRQAAGIAVWVRVSRSHPPPEIMWINPSGLPVFDVTLHVATPHAFTQVNYLVSGPPAEARAEMSRTSEAVVDAHDPDTDWLAMMDRHEIATAAIFRDAEEQVWFRDYKGTLHGPIDQTSAIELEGSVRPWRAPGPE